MGAVLTIDTNPVTQPLNGTLVLQSNGQFTYTADQGFVGTDFFVYQVIDEHGGAQQAKVVLDVIGKQSAAGHSPGQFYDE